MNRRNLFLLPIAFFAAALEGQLTIRAEAIPDRMLPGIPPSFIFHAENSSAQPVTLLNAVNLHVTPLEGEPFFAEWQDRSSDSFNEDQFPLVVPPHGSRDFVLPLDVTLVTPAFFFDPRLARPGSYRLRVHLYIDTGGNVSQDVASNDVRFLVETPGGEDAVVWHRMQDLAKGRWNTGYWAEYGFTIASEIIHHHPTSRYMPYVSTFNVSRSHAASLEVLESAIALHPVGPIADTVRLGQVAVHNFASADALEQGRLETAINELEAARAIMQDVATRSIYPFMRATAERGLAKMLTSDQLRALQQYDVEHAPPAPLSIIPKVECVDVIDQLLIARFGYDNPNAALKIIPAGGRLNRLSVDERKDESTDDGEPVQPERFGPNRHPNVFSVTTKEDEVTWFLDGQAATARRDGPRCGPTPSAVPVRPFVDCVKKSGQTLLVQFGYDNPNPYAAVVSSGTDNTTQPGGSVPPTLFLSGVHHNVWSMKAKGAATISWTLQGTTLTAGENGVPKCN